MLKLLNTKIVDSVKVANCLCECGNKISVPLWAFKNKHRTSCGCYFHGESNSKTARSWKAMKTRCLNENADNYERYGGKGTKICVGLMSFLVFQKTIGKPPSDKHSVDRIESNLHYSCGVCNECINHKWPMNIKWSTPRQQRLNNSFVNYITYNGVTLCLTDWAKRLGIGRSTLNARINTYNWSVEKSFTYKTKKHDITL